MTEYIIYDDIKFYKQDESWRKMTKPRKFLHQYIWEKYNGPIQKGFDVHHKDDNHSNNDIDNLTLLTHGEHSTHHNLKREYKTGYKLAPFTDEHKNRLSASSKNRKIVVCEYCNKKVDVSNYGRWHGIKCKFSNQQQ